MLQRFHGMDRHKKFSTISVLNREGEELRFLSACYDLWKYIKGLGAENAVILEACSGAFCTRYTHKAFAMLRASYLSVFFPRVLADAKPVRIQHIADSPLREFGIPCVYKPSAITRELRKRFSQYELLNRQIRMLKNNIQAILMENGLVISSKEVAHLIPAENSPAIVKELDISEASHIGIEVSQKLLWAVFENKERLHREILRAGEPRQQEVKRLITIKGITPLTALAFSRCGGRYAIQEPTEDERVSGIGSQGEGERREKQVRPYQSGIPEADLHNPQPIDSIE